MKVFIWIRITKKKKIRECDLRNVYIIILYQIDIYSIGIFFIYDNKCVYIYTIMSIWVIKSFGILRSCKILQKVLLCSARNRIQVTHVFSRNHNFRLFFAVYWCTVIYLVISQFMSLLVLPLWNLYFILRL